MRLCATFWRLAGKACGLRSSEAVFSRYSRPHSSPSMLKQSVRILNWNAGFYGSFRGHVSSFSTVANQPDELAAIAAELASLPEKIAAVEADINMYETELRDNRQSLNEEDKNFYQGTLTSLRKKKEQLRKKEEQLRTDREQLLKKEEQLRELQLIQGRKRISDSVDSVLGPLPQNLSDSEYDMTQYIEVARKLLSNGYYGALTEVIHACQQSKHHTFVVMDCPSGSGKTLAGVALRLLDAKLQSDDSRSAAFHYATVGYRVVHVVWPSAIAAQSIYSGIHEKQEKEGIYVNEFYSRAERMVRSLRDQNMLKPSDIVDHVWKECLQYLFRREGEGHGAWDVFKFKREYGVTKLILFLDEIPTNPEQVTLVGHLRDYCKMDKDIVIIFAGTNSKAANMIGFTSKDASASDPAQDDQPWAFLVTRLPGFVPEYSIFRSQWEELKRLAVQDGFTEVVEAISCSIHGKGNPRLINFGIKAAKELADETKISFSTWQRKLATLNATSKFTVSRWSFGFDVLVGQSNLLLEAAADHTKSDVLMRGHYAQRAVPDGSSVSGTVASSGLKDCGGWLHISKGELRGLGCQLYLTVPNNSDKELYDWQVTVFQKPHLDFLLYLACCMDAGFLSYVVRIMDDSKNQQSLAVKHSALQVLRWLWSSDAFGYINFQNLSAPLNTGKYLETLVTLALFNAASESDAEFLTLEDFMVRFIRQLGHTHNAITPFQDPVFRGPKVPRILLPDCNQLVFSNNKYIGFVKRVPNSDRTDIVLSNVQGQNARGYDVKSITFECKDRDQFSIGDLRTAALNLVKSDGEIGVLVLRDSTEHWFDSGIPEEKLKELTKSNIGTIHFICWTGRIFTQVLDQNRDGRLIVVRYQVPPLWSSKRRTHSRT